jgi:glycerol-3-phosphate acyltransferase PlsY
MLELGIKTLLAYFLGTLLGSLILGRFRGVDIRKMGSGNAGGTNALRTQGKAFALGVMVIDVGKGALACGWLPHALLPGLRVDPSVARDWLAVACGAAVVAGHVYPVWFEFRGGKGAATVVGALALLQPWTLVPLFAVWLLIVVLTGFVGLASMSAGIAIAIFTNWREPSNTPMVAFCFAMAGFIVFTHRSNILRMLNGAENRVKGLWLFKPRAR